MTSTTAARANQDLLARAFAARQNGDITEAASLAETVLTAVTDAQLPSAYHLRGFLKAIADPKTGPGTLHTHWKAAEHIAATLDQLPATNGSTR